MKRNRCAIRISFIGFSCAREVLLLLRLKIKLSPPHLWILIKIHILPPSFTNYSHDHSLNNCGIAHSLYRRYSMSEVYLVYRMAQNSVNWLVKYIIEYETKFLIIYWIYKNFSKWDPPCSMHNSQNCHAVINLTGRFNIRENFLG
jgi:hypothetical protein